MSETEQETIRIRLAQQERLLNDLQGSYAQPTKEAFWKQPNTVSFSQ